MTEMPRRWLDDDCGCDCGARATVPPVVRAEVAHCVHVFIGQLDVCLICGTPNPASLR